MSREIIAGLAENPATRQITATIPSTLLFLVEKISKIEYNGRNGQMSQFMREGLMEYLKRKPAVIPVLEKELKRLKELEQFNKS